MGGAIKKFRKKMRNFGKNEKLEKTHSAKKGGKSHSVKKSGRGDPSALEWLFISC